MSILKDLLTDDSGLSYDTMNVMLVVATIAFLAITAYDVYITHTFDPRANGEGLGFIWAAHGASKSGTRFIKGKFGDAATDAPPGDAE